MEAPFVIVGAGAIGGIVGAHLLRSGHEVVFIEVNAAHAEAIRAGGLRISGALDAVVRAPAHAPDTFEGPIERLLLAVKSRDTVAALEPLAARLAPGGYVLSLQNGLEEEKIATLVGRGRTVGAFLTFGGYYREPGHVVYGGAGSFKVGELDGRASPRCEDLRAALSAQQPVEVTDNILGHLWAKLALGAVYFGTALVDAPVLEIYADRQARAVLEQLAGETAAVAALLGIRVETCDGFDPKAFRPGADDAEREASWDAQRAYWGRHDNAYTGVWRDLKVHHRPTEVDWQVGAVLRAAGGLDAAVPCLAALADRIKAVERGEARQDWALLRSLGNEAGHADAVAGRG